MPNIFLEFSTLSIFVLLTFAIYLVILVVFIYAGRKYKGGIVGRAIQFIIATIGFFLPLSKNIMPCLSSTGNQTSTHPENPSDCSLAINRSKGEYLDERFLCNSRTESP